MNYPNSCYHGNQSIIPSVILRKRHIQRKGIFKATYLLPARQNMNNFKHILHNIHLQYKHKIIVFKIPGNIYHGNRNCQKRFYSVAKKYYEK